MYSFILYVPNKNADLGYSQYILNIWTIWFNVWVPSV